MKIKIKIDIHSDLADKIVGKTLLESIDLIYEDYLNLLEKEELQSYQKEDLACDLLDLKALKRVYSYYNVDTGKLDKYEL